MNPRKFAHLIRRSIRVMEANGYVAAPAHISGFDIIGLSSTDVVLVRVCEGKPPWAGAIAELRHVTAPPNTRLLLHVWKSRRRLPECLFL